MLSPDLIIGRGESDPRHERVRPGAAAISWTHLDLVTTTSFSPAAHTVTQCRGLLQPGAVYLEIDRNFSRKLSVSKVSGWPSHDCCLTKSLSGLITLLSSSAVPGPGRAGYCGRRQSLSWPGPSAHAQSSHCSGSLALSPQLCLWRESDHTWAPVLPSGDSADNNKPTHCISWWHQGRSSPGSVTLHILIVWPNVFGSLNFEKCNHNLNENEMIIRHKLCRSKCQHWLLSLRGWLLITFCSDSDVYVSPHQSWLAKF